MPEPSTSASRSSRIIGGLEERYFEATTYAAAFRLAEKRGRVTAERPDKMRWEFSEPGDLVISDGVALWTYDAAKKTARKLPPRTSPWFYGLTFVLVPRFSTLMDKLGLLARPDFLKAARDAGLLGITTDALEGTIHGDSTGVVIFARVSEWQFYHPKEYDIRAVQVRDFFSEGVTTFRFDDAELGKPSSPGAFVFSLPPGATVQSP